jgi:hypothetical protein
MTTGPKKDRWKKGIEGRMEEGPYDGPKGGMGELEVGEGKGSEWKGREGKGGKETLLEGRGTRSAGCVKKPFLSSCKYSHEGGWGVEPSLNYIPKLCVCVWIHITDTLYACTRYVHTCLEINLQRWSAFTFIHIL